jgi:hypothetical protein
VSKDQEQSMPAQKLIQQSFQDLKIAEKNSHKDKMANC